MDKPTYELKGVSVPILSDCASCIHLPAGVVLEPLRGAGERYPLADEPPPLGAAQSPSEGLQSGSGAGDRVARPTYLCYAGRGLPRWACGMFMREAGSDDDYPSKARGSGGPLYWNR